VKWLLAFWVRRPLLTNLVTAFIVLAFVPVIFLGGLEGKFLWPFPVMVAVVLGASLFECLSLLPSHLAHGGTPTTPPPKAWLRHLQAVYDRVIHHAIRCRYLTILLSVTLFAGILAFGAMALRFNLYPEMEIDTVTFKVELSEGASFAYTTRCPFRSASPGPTRSSPRWSWPWPGGSCSGPLSPWSCCPVCTRRIGT